MAKQRYRVYWGVELEGESVEEVARKGFRNMKDPDCPAGIMTVVSPDGSEALVDVLKLPPEPDLN